MLQGTNAVATEQSATRTRSTAPRAAAALLLVLLRCMLARRVKMIVGGMTMTTTARFLLEAAGRRFDRSGRTQRQATPLPAACQVVVGGKLGVGIAVCTALANKHNRGAKYPA